MPFALKRKAITAETGKSKRKLYKLIGAFVGLSVDPAGPEFQPFPMIRHRQWHTPPLMEIIPCIVLNHNEGLISLILLR